MNRARVGLVAVALAIVGAVIFVVIAHRDTPTSPTKTVPATWEQARTSPMHALHVGSKKVACTECHAQGFDAPPSEDSCAKGACHGAVAANAHVGNASSKTPCLTCHVFGANKAAASCVDCHSGKPVAAPAAHASAPCASCHAVHGAKGERAVLGDCTACHAGGAVHGRAHVAPSDAGVEAGVLAPETARVDAPLAALLFAAGPHPAPSDAAGAMCSSCHAPHQPRAAAREACAGCHVAASRVREGARLGASPDVLAGGGLAAIAAAAPEVTPRGPRTAGHEACVTCNAPHDATRAATKACATCHADHAGASKVSAHAACTTCHAPHAPREAATACARCHEGKAALSAATVTAHAACNSCHDPHRPDRAPASACASCHALVSPTHPGAPASAVKLASSAGAACVGCHKPHGAGAKVSACSSCHTKARDDRAFHAKTTACSSCHAPHAFQLASAGAALCAKCHAPVAAAVASRKGHAACASCHGAAHTPTPKPACSKCHADEARTAPRGHAACASCHDAHSGSLGTHKECASCHADKPKAQHGGIAGGCATCHRPHGPKGPASPPACTTCHAPAKLPGLHSVGAHAPCSTCHTSHAAPRSDRATCVGACHADRKGHQPEAATCKGCHMFRR